MKFSPPRGTRDIMPGDFVRLQYVIDTARAVFERFGFKPLETPTFEDWALLSTKGGEAIKDEIYYFKDKSGRELGLRFDLTVPLARVIASNPQLQKPFKRYQIGRVWRYDNPQAGRFREFWQADADIVGSSSPEADAEVIALAASFFERLGFSDFTIRLNNRDFMEKRLAEIGIEKSKVIAVFRTIDKLDKIGSDEAKKLLEKEVGKKAEEIMNLIKSAERPGEFSSILKLLGGYGYEKNVKIDFSLVRGLEYYTGPVFEFAAGVNYSLAGGGRYDNLIEKLGGKSTPATGISFGLERIAGLMEKRKMFPPQKKAGIYIAPLSENVMQKAIEIATELRKKKDVELGFARSVSSQLKYADSKGIEKVVIVGEKDVKEGCATIRNMKTGKEEKAKLDKIAGALQ